jgi:tetratricopeptide (TPR) repeat protein
MSLGTKIELRLLRLECVVSLVLLAGGALLTVVSARHSKSSSTPESLSASRVTAATDSPVVVAFPESSAACRIPTRAAIPVLLVRGDNPQDSAEVLRQAQADLEANRLDAALEKCREAIRTDPTSAHGYYLLGVVELARGAQEEAKQALLESVKRDTSHIGTHVYLGKVYLLTKEWQAATEEFQTAMKLGDATGSGQFGLALALLGKEQYHEALPHLLASVAADPRDPERLFTLIATELRVKQVASARKHLAEIEKLSPEDAWLSFRLGKVLEERGLSEEAEGALEHAASLLAKTTDSPGPPDLKLSEVYIQLARLRYDHHDYPGTLQYLDKVELRKLDPKAQGEVLHLRGAALLEVGQMGEAPEKLKQAAERNPSAPDYFVHWAWAELLAGNIQAAKAAAEVARNKWPDVQNVQLLQAVLARESMPERARVPFLAGWHLKGEGLVCCPCKVPCPCRSNAPPTYGHCENTGAYRIMQGHYGSVRLDGLTFAAVDASMGQENIPSSVYVPPSTTDEQLIALERIFQTFNPLRPFIFMNVKRARISFADSRQGRAYDVSIPGVLQINIQRQVDSKGSPLVRTAALDYFSNTLEYARNVTYKVWDEDGRLRWDFSGRQANFRTVDLDSRNYVDQQMLIQYGDGSGFFNKKQLQLIKSLKLPTLNSYPKSAR